jgi:hypothetical protein
MVGGYTGIIPVVDLSSGSLKVKHSTMRFTAILLADMASAHTSFTVAGKAE